VSTPSSLDQKSGWIIGAVELQPISTAKLYLEDDDRELKFLNDQDGKTTSLMFGKLKQKGSDEVSHRRSGNFVP
jgi:hypothetical protein